MGAHLIAKLEQFTRLSSADKQALYDAASLTVRRLNPREDLVREGEKPKHVNLILEGWACRYKLLEDGRRQIIAFLIPGDLCNLRMFILKELDDSIAAITPLKVAEMTSDTILDLTDSSPRISRAFWWNSLVEEAIQREWITSLGRRDAVERMAHLLCEWFVRLKGVGLTNRSGEGLTFEVPVTQEQLGDALGVSSVHANRTLQDLREAGLVIWKAKRVTIPDLEALKAAALFTPNYLHLDRDGQALDANET
jgi:CRP-like cAMP-binding protein